MKQLLLKVLGVAFAAAPLLYFGFILYVLRAQFDNPYDDAEFDRTTWLASAPDPGSPDAAVAILPRQPAVTGIFLPAYDLDDRG